MKKKMILFRTSHITVIRTLAKRTRWDFMHARKKHHPHKIETLTLQNGAEITNRMHYETLCVTILRFSAFNSSWLWRICNLI